MPEHAPLPAPTKRKLLLIGWDAADWKVALPLVEQGKMPHLKALMQRGVWGRNATIRPVLSPMLWTSIATGKRAYKHGIYGFSEPTPDGQGIQPISNLSRKTRALWNIFTLLGMKSNVVGWWPSHPAEPINGVMVSNHFQAAVADLDKAWPMRPGTVYPPELAAPLSEMRIHPAELENEHILPFIPKAAQIDQQIDKRMESCAKIIAEISSIHAASTALMQLESWDFMAMYLDGIDHFGHGFMKYHPPRQDWVNEQDFELYKDVVESAYRYHDLMLGTLLTLAGPDTTIMLTSDHGFEPGNMRPKHLPNEPAGPAEEHSPYGMFLLAGPGVRKGEEVHGVCLLDIAPTILHLYGLPVGRDMDGKVLVNCFEKEETPTYIDSWDDFSGSDGRHPEGSGINSMDNAESIRQLVALGYIDEPNPDRAKAVEETTRELKYNLAQAYQDGGLLMDAAQTFEALWERWPGESRFGTHLLNCWIGMEDAAKARETLTLLCERKKAGMAEAAKEMEELIAPYKTKAEEEGREWKAADLEKAKAHRLRQLCASATLNPAALAFHEARVLELEGNYAKALEALETAAKIQTHNQPSLLCRRARICTETGDLASARNCYEKALSIEPEQAEALLGLALIDLKEKRLFEAAGNALASIGLQYVNPRAHLAYGLALSRLRKPKMAEMTLLCAVAQNPGLAEAHKALARLYSQKALKNETLAKKHAELADSAAKSRKKRLGQSRKASGMSDLPALHARPPGADSAPAAKSLIVVSGMPRSGTSLMMQMLEAAGLPIVSDGQRAADDSNPRGYYEDERVKKLPFTKDRSWLRQCLGKVVKIVAPVLPAIPPELPCRIIFMERSAAELLKSQKTMLERSGTTSGSEASLASAYAAQLKRLDKMLQAKPSVAVLPLSHASTIAEPLESARAVAQFLGMDLDIEAMAAVVDPSLHRAR